MNAIKFSLSGRTAFFKKPDVNTYLYFTYGQIHKIALLGMVGAILGFKGYAQQSKNDVYPEFYSRLGNLKVAIRPETEKGYTSKKMQLFNNSVGYASQEQGGNLIVKEQWLEDPKWTIYLLTEDHADGLLIEKHFLEKHFIYYPYLGKNDHFATIRDIELVSLQGIEEVQKLDSLFVKDENTKLESVYDEDGYTSDWKYEESLPISLNLETNQYETKKFAFTNMNAVLRDTSLCFLDENKCLFFF
ncbi:type I-B CRISPR-associated protein Cas5b [Psychrobacillus sp. NPDC093180]|uniref:type I-B CRISPR-associated protein Cas5b n=1 Tax=Psychrobacillus sp. NPDC093180 TaxID=3364489 RepID=UPI003814F38C